MDFSICLIPIVHLQCKLGQMGATAIDCISRGIGQTHLETQ